jgi:hypothetical protein
VPSVNAFDNVLYCPMHIAMLPIMPDGTGFTLTVTVADATGIPITVELTVYVVVTDGVAIVLAQVVQESPDAGSHIYPEPSVAVKVVELPRHIAVLLPALSDCASDLLQTNIRLKMSSDVIHIL